MQPPQANDNAGMKNSDHASGIYPMLYAFFTREGGLDRQATRRQVQAFVDNGAHGMAVLGLGTEVNKLPMQNGANWLIGSQKIWAGACHWW
jgi:hypothetical protein